MGGEGGWGVVSKGLLNGVVDGGDFFFSSFLLFFLLDLISGGGDREWKESGVKGLAVGSAQGFIYIFAFWGQAQSRQRFCLSSGSIFLFSYGLLLFLSFTGTEVGIT